MRFSGSLPPVRPIAVAEIETGFAVGVMECFVHGQCAVLRVELQQKEACFRSGDHQAIGLRIKGRPVGFEGVAELEAGDFDRFSGFATLSTTTPWSRGTLSTR